MRKVVLEAFGGPQVLRLADAPEPMAPPGGCVVELAAIGVNFAELVERRGLYRKDQRLPYEIGKEAAGRVVAVHPDADGIRVGDRVIVIRFEGGCYAERVAALPHQLLPIPAHLDLEEAAAFAIAFATAWYAQEELARVRTGEAVLIQAAAGATGGAAIQLARARGCDPVIGVVGRAAKREAVLGLGAHLCAAESEGPSFEEVVREHCGSKGGVDYCLESVGGAVFDRSLSALAPLGRLVAIGFSSVEKDHANTIKRVHPLQLFLRSWGLMGLNVENIDFPRRRATFERLAAFAAQHGLRPAIGGRFPLCDAAGAHAAIEARNTTGKVLLIP